ncbi:hypothetical protein CLOP_g12644 [Closterium sp. NIES-67]|nr:hypothetical protein CLOP_g12644 [Closterium sp. NIES-67]
MEIVAHPHATAPQPDGPRRFFLVSKRRQKTPASAAAAAAAADAAAEAANRLLGSTGGTTRALFPTGAEQHSPAGLLGDGAAWDVAAGAERRERSARDQHSELRRSPCLTPSGGTSRAAVGESAQQPLPRATAEAWPGDARCDDDGARKKRKSFCSAAPSCLPSLLQPRAGSASESTRLTSAAPPLPSLPAAAARRAGIPRPDLFRESYSPNSRSRSNHPPRPQPPSAQLPASPAPLSRAATAQSKRHLATTPTTPTTPSHLDHGNSAARNPFESAQLPRKLVLPPFRPPQQRYWRPSSAVASSWDVPPFSAKRLCLPAGSGGTRVGAAHGGALGGGMRAGEGGGSMGRSGDIGMADRCTGWEDMGMRTVGNGMHERRSNQEEGYPHQHQHQHQQHCSCSHEQQQVQQHESPSMRGCDGLVLAQRHGGDHSGTAAIKMAQHRPLTGIESNDAADRSPREMAQAGRCGLSLTAKRRREYRGARWTDSVVRWSLEEARGEGRVVRERDESWASASGASPSPLPVPSNAASANAAATVATVAAVAASAGAGSPAGGAAMAGGVSGSRSSCYSRHCCSSSSRRMGSAVGSSCSGDGGAKCAPEATAAAAAAGATAAPTLTTGAHTATAAALEERAAAAAVESTCGSCSQQSSPACLGGHGSRQGRAAAGEGVRGGEGRGRPATAGEAAGGRVGAGKVHLHSALLLASGQQQQQQRLHVKHQNLLFLRWKQLIGGVEEEDDDEECGDDDKPMWDPRESPMFVLSSGRSLSSDCLIRAAKPLTIDGEFEQFFSQLLL